MHARRQKYFADNKTGVVSFLCSDQVKCHSNDVTFQQRPEASEGTAMGICRKGGTGLPGIRVLSTRSDS